MRLLLLFLACMSLLDASKVVLITGASKGIGYETAKLLFENGYIVYAGSRTKPQELPIGIHHVSLDVTDDASVQSAVKTVLATEGKIDVLINNAGIIYYGSAENVTIDEAKEMFEVNFFGVMRMMQAVLPSMRQRRSGKIIQMSSRSGFRPLPSIAVYAASKFALEGLTEALAATLKPWNIHVSLIEPGPVQTGMVGCTPYGSHLPVEADPYLSIFTAADLFSQSRFSQTASEIARFIQDVIEEESPHLRYQTSNAIRKQAEMRLVDPTGTSSLQELEQLLFPIVSKG